MSDIWTTPSINSFLVILLQFVILAAIVLVIQNTLWATAKRWWNIFMVVNLIHAKLKGEGIAVRGVGYNPKTNPGLANWCRDRSRSNSDLHPCWLPCIAGYVSA